MKYSNMNIVIIDDVNQIFVIFTHKSITSCIVNMSKMNVPQKINTNITDVYSISKPIFYFARLCGLWPHTMKRSAPGVETGSLLWYFIVFSIYVYAFYMNLDKTFWNSFSQLTGSDIQT